TAQRQVGAGFARRCRREIKRQADSEKMPLLAATGDRRMYFSTDQGGELLGAPAPSVCNREAVGLEKVIGNANEVVAAFRVAAAHFPGRQLPVRLRGMRVKIAAIEAARCRKCS